MKIDLVLFLLICAVIIIVVLLLRNCNRNTVTTVQTTTTMRIDTLRSRDTVYFPKPYKVVERYMDTVYIDTFKTIRDYFTEKYYRLVYEDSLLKAVAELLVAENCIELAKLDYEVYRPVIHTFTLLTEEKRDRFFLSLGAGVSYSIRNKRAGVELLAAFGKKRQSIHLGYDFVNQTPRIGWQYQLK